MGLLHRITTLTRAMFTKPTDRPPTGAAGPTWTTIGASTGVTPGNLAAFPMAGGPIAVANVAGTYYAFDDTCTHRRCSLAEGELDGTVVTCVCHGSQFDVTSGAVQHGPAETPVGSYAVRLEGSDLQIQR